jgi:hypothetical protein
MEEEFLKFFGNILLSTGADGNKILFERGWIASENAVAAAGWVVYRFQ